MQIVQDAQTQAELTQRDDKRKLKHDKSDSERENDEQIQMFRENFIQEEEEMKEQLKGSLEVQRTSSSPSLQVRQGLFSGNLGEQHHPLELKNMIQEQINNAKESYSKIIYIHKLVQCFYTDDIFQHLMHSISDQVAEKFKDKLKESQIIQHKREGAQEGQRDNSKQISKILEEKRVKELDPVKLARRVEILQEKLDKQTKDFYTELSIYRNQFRQSQNQSIQNDFKQFFEVKLFDECDQIPPEYIALMNQRLQDMQTQYSVFVQTQLETQRALLIKLHCYEKLKPQQFCIIDLTVDEIIESLPILEQDAQKIWDFLEKHYRPNFFEHVIYKKYGYLFEDKEEDNFRNEMIQIRSQVRIEVLELTRQYENIIKQMRSDFSEKQCELYELKDKYQKLMESVQVEEEDRVRAHFIEKENLIFSRWEQERVGLMDEIKDLEREHAHIDLVMAKEKFKMFAFKWRIYKKVQKMKLLDRDSYDFTKASLEVQEMVKIDIDAKIQVATQELKAKYDQARQDKYNLLDEASELRFKNTNLMRLIAQIQKSLDEMRWQCDTLDSNLRYSKEKTKELENQRDLLSNENQNLREMVKSLTEKNEYLSKKIEKITNEKNLSFLDIKFVFGRADKTLSKTRLVEEIDEIIRRASKKLQKMHVAKETRNQAVGTEIRNIHKEVCYKRQHGEGILVHQETQNEKVFYFGREVQTDETLLQELIKMNQQTVQNSGHGAFGGGGQSFTENKNTILNVQNQPRQGNSPLQKSAQESINSSLKNSIQASIIDSLQSRLAKDPNSQHPLMRKYTVQTKKDRVLHNLTQNSNKQSFLNSRKTSGQDTDSLAINHKSKNLQTGQRPQLNKQQTIKHQKVQQSYKRSKNHKEGERQRAQKTKDENGISNHDSIEDEDLEEFDEQEEENQSLEMNQVDEINSNLNETDTLLGRFEKNPQVLVEYVDDVNPVKIQVKDKNQTSKNQKSIQNQQKPQNTTVFTRLWNKKTQRDEKLKQYRDLSRENEDREWKIKLANSNQLQKTFEGMNVFRDPHTGRCFIHINDLRQKVAQAVNDKDKYVAIGQSQNNSHQLLEQTDIEIYNSADQLDKKEDLVGNQGSKPITLQNQLEQQSNDESPEKVYVLPKINRKLKSRKGLIPNKRQSESTTIYSGMNSVINRAQSQISKRVIVQDKNIRSSSQESKYTIFQTPSQMTGIANSILSTTVKDRKTFCQNENLYSASALNNNKSPQKYDTLISNYNKSRKLKSNAAISRQDVQRQVDSERLKEEKNQVDQSQRSRNQTFQSIGFRTYS